MNAAIEALREAVEAHEAECGFGCDCESVARWAAIVNKADAESRRTPTHSMKNYGRVKDGRLPEPPLNTSREAVQLRQAAQAFAFANHVEHDEDPDNNDEDITGQRKNIDLLRAAIAYTRIVDRAVTKRGRK